MRGGLLPWGQQLCGKRRNLTTAPSSSSSSSSVEWIEWNRLRAISYVAKFCNLKFQYHLKDISPAELSDSDWGSRPIQRKEASLYATEREYLKALIFRLFYGRELSRDKLTRVCWKQTIQMSAITLCPEPSERDDKSMWRRGDRTFTFLDSVKTCGRSIDGWLRRYKNVKK